MSNNLDILVGTYSVSSSGRKRKGDGIYKVAFDIETGAFGIPRLLVECVNPSALVLSPDRKMLFAVREVFAPYNPGLSSFKVTTSGDLIELSHVQIAAELPCHLAYDPVHQRLASAQYWTGEVVLSSVVNETLQTPTYLRRTGSGPNAERQTRPHAHCVAFSDIGEVLHLVDLGTDDILSHKLNDKNEAVETATLRFPAGSGPRHMVLNQDATRAWVFCELDESLVLMVRNGLGWNIVSIQPGFAAPIGEDGAGAAIRLSPDEQHVYISGRRQSSIAGFTAVGTPLGEADCGGISPREFIISSDGNWLISANQDSNALTSLRRSEATGALTLTGYSCSIGRPVALLEI